MVGGGLAVAGQDNGAQALMAQFFEHVPGLRADVVAQDEPPEEAALDKPDFR